AGFRGAAALPLQFGGQPVDALAELAQVVAGGHAEADQGLLHARLEHLFQAVPGVGGAFARLADSGFHRLAHLFRALPAEAACGLFQAHAFLDQGVEQPGAFGLGAAEGADAGEPDLLRRFADRLRQALGLGLGPGGGRGTFRGLLEPGHVRSVWGCGKSSLGPCARAITPRPAWSVRDDAAIIAGRAAVGVVERARTRAVASVAGGSGGPPALTST